MTIITIKCEQDAWDVLEKYHENPPKNAILNIENFESFKYYINGSKYKATLNTDMMSSVILLQQTIYRLYAFFKYNSPDARKLSKKDKEKLEIIITVSEGSSKIEAEIVEILRNIFSHMESEHLLILGCFVALCYFGSKTIDHYIDKEQDKKYLDIIDKVANKIPEARYIKEDSDILKDKIIKNSINFNDGVTYQNKYISQDIIREKAKQTKERALPVRLDGKYKINGLDYEDEYTRFNLEVVDVSGLKTGETFYAYLYNDIFKKDTIVFKTHKEEKYYQLQINGTKIKDIIHEATIYSIEDII